MNEADTCRTYIIPKLKSAGWEDEAITEQLDLMPGRIVPIAHLRRAKVNALRELQSPALHYGDCRCFARRSQSVSGDASQVAPAFWADADAEYFG